MVRSTADKHALYFEVILQLRDISQEVVDFTEDEIARVGLRVAKFVKLKSGFDYYLSDTALTKALGKRLQEKFGGDNQITASIFGQKDGKEIYRTTILFRQAHFQKGDVVEYKNENYKIKTMGKDIYLQNVKTGKKVHLKYKNMGELKKI